MLYSLPSMGGKPRYILADEPPKLMLIPDEVRKCVAFVGYRLPTGDLSLQGTAFFVSREIEGTGRSFIHIVTARHVIQGIESKAPDGKVCLRINFKDGNAYSVETDISQWVFHPEESEVDVAVRPFAVFSDDVDIRTISVPSFLNEQKMQSNEIGIGEEVFLTGLFYNHHGRTKNIPIVRVGNIVALPEERVRTKMGLIDAFLVEARSIGGISGSPVFVHLGLLRNIGGQLMRSSQPRPTFYLMGLMHGHYETDAPSEDLITEDARNKERVNMGIAIVVPSEKILEVLEQPMIREKEKEVEAALREELLPTADSVPDEGAVISREDFEEALRRASRKTSSQPESKNDET